MRYAESHYFREDRIFLISRVKNFFFQNYFMIFIFTSFEYN